MDHKSKLNPKQFRRLESFELELIAGGDAPPNPDLEPDPITGELPWIYITEDGQIFEDSSSGIDGWGQGDAGDSGGGNEIVVTGNNDGGSSGGNSGSDGSPQQGYDAYDPTSAISFLLQQFNSPNNFILVTGTQAETGEGGSSSASSAEHPSPCQADPVHVTIGNNTISGFMGASYYVPEEIDNSYLLGAWNHIAELNASGASLYDKMTEIFSMYQDEDHEFHVDFKDYDAPNITYESNAAGEPQSVTTSPFEAFGNFFFGFIMTGAGFAYEETKAIAGATQGLPSGMSVTEAVGHALERLLTITTDEDYGDDPIDSVHVSLGASAAIQYLAAVNNGVPPATLIDVQSTPC